jgi:putative ABC transport system permease protein
MIRNYFTIALRNIRRYSVHSMLNISGMAIGMGCALLILLWVQDEWSYDRHFKNADNLYRVLENQYYTGGQTIPTAITPTALAPGLKEDYPEIIRASRYLDIFKMPLQKGDEFINEAFAPVDKDFLKMFNIEFVHGDIKSALNGPHDIVITEELTHKYFGDENPVGKTLTSMGMIFTVTGVVKGFPHNSHIRFDGLIPFGILTEMFGVNTNEWEGYPIFTYVELIDGTDSKIADKNIKDIIKKHNKKSNTEIFLQNIKKIHLFSSGKYASDISGHGDIAYVRILGLIAIFILIMACINFMNLSTAQSVRRAKEIGVRKVAGANKQNIVMQFLGESLLIVFVAHAIAMILVELMLPGFNNLLGKQLHVNYQSIGLYIGLITMVLFCSLLAGSYPALYLSSMKPMNTIKGIINKNPGNAGFRRALVIFQFSLSVLLIICTLLVGRQYSYMKNKKLGLNKDNIGYFISFGIQPEMLKRDLGNNPDILSVTNACPIINGKIAESGFNWSGKKAGNDVLFHLFYADEDYAKTFQLEIKEGRFFSSEFPTDANAVVINEQAEKIMGFTDPVGEMVSSKDGSEFRIVGVVKDFHFQSLHNKIEPLIMMKGNDIFCSVRMKPDHIPATVDFIRKTLKSYNLPYSVDFKFLNDDYDNMYRTEQRMGKIFRYFSFLAIIISCLGLVGLSLFMTGRRTKEIGIRKANGAKAMDILSLLSKEYILWVLISILIASPVAWYAMHKWIQNFAYRININWEVFVLSGSIALLIALMTVGLQSYKAAGKDPVEGLRYE